MDMFCTSTAASCTRCRRCCSSPGFLTLEYFAGRRMRYVAPFRLMFVLCLLAFFVFHLALDQLRSVLDSHCGRVTTTAFDRPTRAAEVQHDLQDAVKGMRAATRVAGLQQARCARHADRRERRHWVPRPRERLAELARPDRSRRRRRPAAAEATSATEAGSDDAGTSSRLRRQDSRRSHIGWLPDFANARAAPLGHCT